MVSSWERAIGLDTRPGAAPIGGGSLGANTRFSAIRSLLDDSGDEGGDEGGGGSGGGDTMPQITTNGVTQQYTFNYGSELPALTAEQQQLLAGRRRLATRQLNEVEDTTRRERARLEADAERRRGIIAEDQTFASREGMQTLAGRGVARAPMFVNPFQRRLATQAQRQIGELESGLAASLANLETALRQAEINREREINQIDFDRASYRSDVGAILGA